jgi:hypothetical protein
VLHTRKEKNRKRNARLPDVFGTQTQEKKSKKKMEEAENPHESLKKMKQKRDENRGEFLIRPGERKTL